MKKILFTMILININLFSFSLNNLDFNKTLKKHEIKTERYNLTNNSEEIKKYIITTDNKNIVIKPNKIVLGAKKNKYFTIQATGNGKKGENIYRLIIEEKTVNRDKTKNNVVYLDKVVRIKQKYYLK